MISPSRTNYYDYYDIEYTENDRSFSVWRIEWYQILYFLSPGGSNVHNNLLDHLARICRPFYYDSRLGSPRLTPRYAIGQKHSIVGGISSSKCRREM